MPFIVGEREDKVLVIVIHHGEAHLAVVILAMHRIRCLIFQRIVHPAHIPLETKAQSTREGSDGIHQQMPLTLQQWSWREDSSCRC